MTGQFQRNAAAVHYAPARGSTIIEYSGKYVWVHRNICRVGNSLLSEDSSSSRPLEYISLTSYGSDASHLKEIIEECKKLSEKGDIGKTLIFTPNIVRRGSTWKRTQSKAVRPWDSVVLRDDMAETVLQDCDHFLRSRATRRSVSTRIFIVWSAWLWEDGAFLNVELSFWFWWKSLNLALQDTALHSVAVVVFSLLCWFHAS